MTFTVLKSSKPSFVLRSRKNADSLLPSCCSCRCLRSSDMVESAASFLSSSTRLETQHHYDRLYTVKLAFYLVLRSIAASTATL